MIDIALQMQVSIDNGKLIPDEQILDVLKQSKLVKALTSDFPEKPLSVVWRLICISEIPFGHLLEYTQKLIGHVYETMATSFGFSLSGDEKNFLPCYNAMIATALCRLERAGDDQVRNALDWINENQPMERNRNVNLHGFRFDRFGGCYNNIPCYIGLAKSVIALQNYKKMTNDSRYDVRLQMGTEYILKHKLYKRLNKDIPITRHILDISFPESYHLNAVELIRFVHSAGLFKDSRTKDLIDFLKSKQTKDGHWKINFRYKAEGYTVFDKGWNSNEWVTYIISKSLSGQS